MVAHGKTTDPTTYTVSQTDTSQETQVSGNTKSEKDILPEIDPTMILFPWVAVSFVVAAGSIVWR